MHQKTALDLAILNALDGQIYLLHQEKTKIKDACEHLDYEIMAKETLGFDVVPTRQCMVCNKFLEGITDEEKRQFIIEWYKDIEIEVTEEQIESLKNGFNL